LGAVEWRRGLFGSSIESLNGPIDIALDEHFNIYVLDAGNRRVKVYDQTEYLYAFNELIEPRGIAVNESGDIVFVADYGRKAVNIYRQKKFDCALTSYAGKELYPQDVFWLGSILYVLDSQQKKIFCYGLK